MHLRRGIVLGSSYGGFEEFLAAIIAALVMLAGIFSTVNAAGLVALATLGSGLEWISHFPSAFSFSMYS